MQTVISKDGTRIAYDSVGKGLTVILVGGAFQFRAFDQRTTKLAALLAERFTAIHYDRRGRGDSTDTKPYSVEREVEDIGALLAACGGSAFVFGMSSGAVLAMEAAARGLPITKLALYEAPFTGGDPQAVHLAESYGRQLSSLLGEGRRGDAVELAMTRFGTPPQAIAGMKQSPAWPMFEAVARTLAYDNAVMGSGAVPRGRLGAVKIPTLVIDGGASPEFMHVAAKETAAAISGARRATLDGQTHAYAPEVLAPVLVEFFSA
jgi:pimeloyl-ACP methyl ester carboxylesterase